MDNPFEVINKRLIDIQHLLIDIKYLPHLNNLDTQPVTNTQGNVSNPTKPKTSRQQEGTRNV